MFANVKTAVFWEVMMCSLATGYYCFDCTCCLHHQGGSEPGRGESVNNIRKVSWDKVASSPVGAIFPERAVFKLLISQP
jgi:hypothetical protein